MRSAPAPSGLQARACRWTPALLSIPRSCAQPCAFRPRDTAAGIFPGQHAIAIANWAAASLPRKRSIMRRQRSRSSRQPDLSLAFKWPLAVDLVDQPVDLADALVDFDAKDAQIRGSILDVAGCALEFRR